MKSMELENVGSQPVPGALTASYIILRILIVLNFVYGAAILALLVASLTAETWSMTAIGVPPSSENMPLIRGLQTIALLGVVSVPFQYVILRRLLEIVCSVRAHDPFVIQNASRLQTIAWALLGLQLLALIIGGIARAVSTPAHPLHIDAGFSTGGWLAVLLFFVLARVFAEGARMRADLEGTV
jgi:hypothetical protein